MRRWATLLGLAILVGCSFDWDRYTPVSGGTGGAGGDGGAGGGVPTCDGFVDPATMHCYLHLSDQTGTWDEARQACQALGDGFDLVGISSAEEHAFVIAEPSFEAVLLGGEYVWIGGTDVAKEGDFVWINGESFFYDAWLDGEPNDFELNEDCSVYRVRGGVIGYDDQNCDDSYTPLCERPAAD